MNAQSHCPAAAPRLDPALRRQAEARLGAGAAGGMPGETSFDLQRTLHELQVHQIELELQNDELERLRAETVLERDRYAELFELAPVGVFDLDAQGRVLEVNRAGAALFERDTAQLVGRPLVALLAPQSRQRLQDWLEQDEALSADTVVELELPAGGERRTAQLAGAAGRGGASRLVVLTDISVRKQAEQQTLRAIEGLEQAAATRRELLSRVSHELRTPLNAVIGFSSLLLLDDRRPLDARQRLQAEHIQHAGEHLLELISALLDIGEVETGSLALTLEPVELVALLRDILQELRPMASAAGVGLVDGIASGGPDNVLADRRQLRKVLVHGLTQAIRHSPRGAQVGVGLGQAPAGMLCLTITDSGNGMSAERLRHFQQPFAPLDGALAEIQGPGLGMLVFRLLVEAMHGQVGIDSQPGQGTTVAVTLPRAQP